jgi:hypothetical protein
VKGISAHACSYLHNYSPIKNDPLFSSQFAEQIASFPVFTADHVQELTTYLDKRIRGDNRFTPKIKQSKLPQIQELLKASRTSVLFIDDNQIVRPGEIGSTNYIKAEAEKLNCEDRDYQLEAQFRSAGSDPFVSWINNTLGIQRTPHVMWNQADEFDFRILPNPQALEDEIMKQLEEKSTARLAAGFCWPWSNPKPDGTLVEDVVIGDYKRPWNAKSDSGSLAPGIPKESLWAYEDGGVNQIGCIYTAQGFEFDYVGVIFGPDLVYLPEAADWKGDKTKSFDTVVKRSGDRFTQMVKIPTAFS